MFDMTISDMGDYLNVGKPYRCFQPTTT